jgi:DEAD/DEAH box helicase domain-containing protein
MSLTPLLNDLRRDTGFMANVTAWQTLPARAAQTAPIPDSLHPALLDALAQRDMPHLYSHQHEAVTRALAGENIAVVTPTASGKTLCYTLPVLHQLLSDPTATALYLFPTKALAHDQLEDIGDWILDIDESAPRIQYATYDGDTPSGQRAAIRRESRLLITNPDMLHMGILPYHAGWERFFAGLQTVVIDEMHTYRGVFGSHVANVLRRLQRIAAFYGSQPRFVLTSATIANPGPLAEQLIEQPVTVIDRNGAPQGEKHIILCNPPLYDPVQGLRRSSVLESQDLAVRTLLGGLQTIVFARARLTVEVLLTYIRDRLKKQVLDIGYSGSVSDADNTQYPIRGYRGGYLPEERRAIEAGLRSGEVRGVVTTNALELGIDIGRLEAAILCGYPGTIASAWQQMGRAGRTADASLAILVATAGALDQYLVSQPEFFFERSPEQAVINPDNLMLLVDQLRCAAFELPFVAGENFGRSPITGDVLALLAESGDVGDYAGRFLWQGESYPARQISLRSAGNDPFVIQETDADGITRLVGEIDGESAPLLVHDGAVYIHEGQSYLVEALDWAARIAQVRAVEVDFYTQANSEAETEVLAVHGERTDGGADGGAAIGHGDLRVTTTVSDYRRVRRYTHETLGVFPLDYPPHTLETTGYWLEVTPAAQEVLMQADRWRDAPNDYGPNWQEQRAKMRARDGYACTQCGTPEPAGRQHDVHHLTPFRTFGYIPGHNENYQLANRLRNLTLLCQRCHRRLEAGVRTRSGLDGLGYALGNLASLYLMCDRNDLGMSVVRAEISNAKMQRSKEVESLNAEAQRRRGEEGKRQKGKAKVSVTEPATQYAVRNTSPRIYIFERIAAGLGFSQQLFERHGELLAGAEEMIRGCGCRYGCPACVGPVLLNDGGERPLLETKALALALLEVLRTGEIGQGVSLRNNEVVFR